MGVGFRVRKYRVFQSTVLNKDLLEKLIIIKLCLRYHFFVQRFRKSSDENYMKLCLAPVPVTFTCSCLSDLAAEGVVMMSR